MSNDSTINIDVGKVALKFCGEWNNSTPYKSFDCVKDINQSQYVALKDVPLGTPFTCTTASANDLYVNALIFNITKYELEVYMWETIRKLFDNYFIVGVGAVWGWVVTFLFPTETITTASIAVLIVMALDLLTRIFALSKKNGGFFKAIKNHKIRSNKFAKGTLDKLIIFGVMLVISGCAYYLMVIEELAIWFTQVVFAIMFLRDVLSIIENLSEAGVSGLGMFKHVVKKKFTDYVDKDVIDGKAEVKDKHELDETKPKG